MEWSTGFNRQLQRFLIRNVVVELHGDCGDPDSAFSLHSALEIPGKTVQNRRKIDFPIAFVSCSPGLDARSRGNIEKKRLNPRFPFFQRAGKLEYLIVPVSQPQRKPRKFGRFRQIDLYPEAGPAEFGQLKTLVEKELEMGCPFRKVADLEQCLFTLERVVVLLVIFIRLKQCQIRLFALAVQDCYLPAECIQQKTGQYQQNERIFHLFMFLALRNIDCSFREFVG